MKIYHAKVSGICRLLDPDAIGREVLAQTLHKKRPNESGPGNSWEFEAEEV
jgi:hypothetical protein